MQHLRMLVAALLLTSLSAGRAAESNSPNILVILADDLGYGDVQCYNNAAKVATPHIDRLAREGICFQGNRIKIGKMAVCGKGVL